MVVADDSVELEAAELLAHADHEVLLAVEVDSRSRVSSWRRHPFAGTRSSSRAKP